MGNLIWRSTDNDLQCAVKKQLSPTTPPVFEHLTVLPNLKRFLNPNYQELELK